MRSTSRRSVLSDEQRTDILRALSESVRWEIIRQAAAVPELAGSVLEERLQIARPAVSYHTKILVQAGLLTTRRAGRNVFYTLQQEAFRALIDEFRGLLPGPKAVRIPPSADEARAAVGAGGARAAASAVALAPVVESDSVLTW